MYTALVRPTLEYACTVWDPHFITTIRDLEKVQRRAARFTHNCYTDTTPGCVTNLIDKLGWEPLEHRRTKQRLTMCYKIRHQYIEINPGYYTAGDGRTRGSHKLRQTRAKKEAYHHSFFPRSIRDWNRLPEGVTNTDSLEDFRGRLDAIPWSQLKPTP